MHEGLELLRISGLTEWQFGSILAIQARGMGTSVPSILASLQASEQDGSTLARNVLASFVAADQVLQQMAAGARTARLHGGPGGGAPSRETAPPAET